MLNWRGCKCDSPFCCEQYGDCIDMAVKKKAQYLNALETKKTDTRQEAEKWAKDKKKSYKEAGQMVKITIDYGNDQRWQAKILPKV